VLVSVLPKPPLALHAACDKDQIDPSSKNVPTPTPHRVLQSHRLEATVTLHSRTPSAGQLPTATGCPFGASPARSASVRRTANRAQMLVRLASSGREVVSYTVGGERNVLLNHPDHAQHVLGSNRANYSKDTSANRYFRTEVADGILTADGIVLRPRRGRDDPHHPRPAATPSGRHAPPMPSPNTNSCFALQTFPVTVCRRS
jgi:hypothetical protein